MMRFDIYVNNVVCEHINHSRVNGEQHQKDTRDRSKGKINSTLDCDNFCIYVMI